MEQLEQLKEKIQERIKEREKAIDHYVKVGFYQTASDYKLQNETYMDVLAIISRIEGDETFF